MVLWFMVSKKVGRIVRLRFKRVGRVVKRVKTNGCGC